MLSYLVFAIIAYIIIRLIMTKGFTTGTTIVTDKFNKMSMYLILFAIVGGFNDAIRFGGDPIQFFDWLYNLWLFIRYFIQFPLVALFGYHFFGYIYENKMTSFWNLKINHFVLIILGLISYVVWNLFNFIGISFLKIL